MPGPSKPEQPICGHPSLEEGYSIKHGIEAAGFKVQSQLVWRKTPFVIGRADYHWQHEICWYAFKGPNHPWYGGRDKGTVWDIPKAQKMDGGHPTQKPVECMKRPIENNSSPGQAVYDPFVGSGHHDNRGGDDRSRMPRDRAEPGLCRRCRDALAEFHRADRNSRSDGRCFRIQERLKMASRRRSSIRGALILLFVAPPVARSDFGRIFWFMFSA